MLTVWRSVWSFRCDCWVEN